MAYWLRSQEKKRRREKEKNEKGGDKKIELPTD